MNEIKNSIYALIAEMAGQHNVLVIHRFFIELTDDLSTALLLSQILYWSDRATMNGHWFAKTYQEWTEELSLSEYQVRKATKALLELGIIETKIKKFDGSPTVHYRLNQGKFSETIVKKLQERNLRNFRNDSEETSGTITEPTTEPTTKDLPSNDGAGEKFSLNADEQPPDFSESKTVPEGYMTAYKDYIKELFYNNSEPTKSEWGVIQKAARELIIVRATLQEIKATYDYCDEHFDNFSPGALCTNLNNARKSSRELSPPPQAPTLAELEAASEPVLSHEEQLANVRKLQKIVKSGGQQSDDDKTQTGE